MACSWGIKIKFTNLPLSSNEWLVKPRMSHESICLCHLYNHKKTVLVHYYLVWCVQVLPPFWHWLTSQFAGRPLWWIWAETDIGTDRALWLHRTGNWPKPAYINLDHELSYSITMSLRWYTLYLNSMIDSLKQIHLQLMPGAWYHPCYNGWLGFWIYLFFKIQVQGHIMQRPCNWVPPASPIWMSLNSY